MTFVILGCFVFFSSFLVNVPTEWVEWVLYKDIYTWLISLMCRCIFICVCVCDNSNFNLPQHTTINSRKINWLRKEGPFNSNSVNLTTPHHTTHSSHNQKRKKKIWRRENSWVTHHITHSMSNQRVNIVTYHSLIFYSPFLEVESSILCVLLPSLFYSLRLLYLE